MIPKFRVWLPDVNKMLDVKALIFKENKTKCVCGYAYEFYLEDENAILMQSTGLLDNNGKEVFEGDIILDLGGNKLTVGCHQTAGVYIKDYEGIAFIGELATLEDIEEAIKEINSAIEVVGNIYENPELLDHEK